MIQNHRPADCEMNTIRRRADQHERNQVPGFVDEHSCEQRGNLFERQGKKQKAKLQDNNKKLKEKNSDLRSELKIMKSTVSWKVTKPLRTVKKELSHKSDD